MHKAESNKEIDKGMNLYQQGKETLPTEMEVCLRIWSHEKGLSVRLLLLSLSSSQMVPDLRSSGPGPVAAAETRKSPGAGCVLAGSSCEDAIELFYPRAASQQPRLSQQPEWNYPCGK